MLNVDKYREKILNYDLMNIECYLASLRGADICGGDECRACLIKSLQWLFSEYKLPLLKNGDSLEPGDLIMVRDHYSDKWNKKPFLCYKNGCFITANDGYIGVVGKYEAWKLARLPEDGE